MANFDFESNRVQEDKFRETNNTTWIDKHVPISVSILSNLIVQPIFSCNSNSAALVESFIHALDGLALKSEVQKKVNFLELETTVRNKFNQIFSALNQRRCRKETVFKIEDGCIEEEEEQDVSTKFLQTQKNQLFDLQEKGIATLFQSLASTAQNTTLF